MTPRDPHRVCLVYMPYGDVRYPALGISLLKAELCRAGIDCDVRYFNLLLLAKHMKGRPEQRLHLLNRLGEEWQYYHAAEACFAHQLFPNGRSGRLISDVADEEIRTALEDLRRESTAFIRACLESTDWQKYAIVGFSSKFNQNISSLLLARELKLQFPHLTIVMGGANAEGPMGEELLRSFSFVDFVFSGDSDHSFPEFVKRTIHGQDASDIPGLIFRKPNDVMHHEPDKPVHDIGKLPVPDFDDYFEHRDALGLNDWALFKNYQILPFETSRGCWWGAKHHCTFCGLNGQGMAYRSKSTERVIDELQLLSKRYRPHKIAALDNIMDHRYFSSLLPRLAQLELPLELSYELKSNLRREQVRLLRAAGVTEVQAGIESLSSSTLSRMRKGVSMLQNVLAMRLFREYGIQLNWQHLYGLPGESTEDYASVPDLVPRLTHLPAPSGDGVIQVSLDRFSPYYNAAASFGLSNVRPAAGYSDLYDLSQSALLNLAYRFDFECPSLDKAHLSTVRDSLRASLAFWQQRDRDGADLALFRIDDEALVIDTRLVAPRCFILSRSALALLDRYDSIARHGDLDLDLVEHSGRPDAFEGKATKELYEYLARFGVPTTTIGYGGTDAEDLTSGGRTTMVDLMNAGLVLDENHLGVSLVIERPLVTLRSILVDRGQERLAELLQ